MLKHVSYLVVAVGFIAFSQIILKQVETQKERSQLTLENISILSLEGVVGVGGSENNSFKI